MYTQKGLCNFEKKAAAAKAFDQKAAAAPRHLY